MLSVADRRCITTLVTAAEYVLLRPLSLGAARVATSESRHRRTHVDGPAVSTQHSRRTVPKATTLSCPLRLHRPATASRSRWFTHQLISCLARVTAGIRHTINSQTLIRGQLSIGAHEICNANTDASSFKDASFNRFSIAEKNISNVPQLLEISATTLR